MRHENQHIKKEIIEVLSTDYGISSAEITFHPIGEESISYKVSDGHGTYLVKYRLNKEKYDSIAQVNNLLFELSRFPFIVAPIRTKDRKTELLLSEGVLYVFPFVEGKTAQIPNPEFPKDLVESLIDIMIHVHNYSPRSDVPREDFCPPYQSWMEKISTLAEKRQDEMFAKLFMTHKAQIQHILDNYMRDGENYSKNPPPFVLTHGDVTMSNFIQSSDGLRLIDWDEAMIGPKEADLMFFVDNPHFDRELYLKGTNQQEIDQRYIKYYKDRWAITSILGDLDSLSKPDLGEEDIKEKLRDFEEYINYY